MNSQWHHWSKGLRSLFQFPLKFILLGLLSLYLVIHLTIAPLSAQAIPSRTSSAPAPSPLLQGRSLYAAGQFTAAIQVWQQALQAYEQQGDRLNQALTLSYLSLAYQEMNQWQLAQQSIEQSLKLLQDAAVKPAVILLAQALNTQASLQLHLGQTQAALETWTRSQQFYEQGGDQLGVLGTQLNQATALRTLGFYRRSQQQLEAINQTLTALPDSELKVNGLQNLGVALQVIGDLEQSESILEQGLAIAQRLNATTVYSSLFLSLGKTKVVQGDLPTALADFQEAERLAVNPLEQLQARLSQLHIYSDAAYPIASNHQWHPVEALAFKTYEQLKDLSPSRTVIYSAVNLVATLSKLPDALQPIKTEALAQLLASSVQSAKTLHDPQAEAFALSQWGQLYIQSQQWSNALQLTQNSLAIAREIQADDIAAQSAWQLGRILKQRGKQGEAIAAYTEAVSSLQALRRDLVAVNSNLQFSFRESIEPVYRELVALLLDGTPNQANLLKARETIEALQLAELDNFLREACLNADPQQIDQVDASAAVIYPIILPDRVAVILSQAGKPLTYYATAITKAETEATLRSLLSSIHPVADKADRIRLSQQVYDWLVRPAEEQQLLSQTKTLVFVLDGILRNIPMAVLYDGEHYLIENYAVALSPGLQLMKSQNLDQANLNAIVAGISESRQGFSALPGVEAEVKEISHLVSASLLLNQQFTREALAKKIQDDSANIVHLATHGQFSSRLEDTFLLTWGDRLDIRSLSELLQNRETRRSKAVELLVLSACDTATGDERAVLGLAGLAVKSGARSTIATLWPVKDKAASLLMTELYEQLRQSGISKAEALRRAQLSILQQTDFKEPFFWSAFVLVGNWL